MFSPLNPQNLPEGICVLVDGGCLNNNKPVTERHMYVSLKVYHNGKPVSSTYVVTSNGDEERLINKQHRFELGLTEDGEGSNQLAELYAMQYAYTYAIQLRQRTDQVTAITILTDSQYALGWGSQAYSGNRKTSERVKGFGRWFETFRSMLNKKGVTVAFQHVPESWVKTQLGH